MATSIFQILMPASYFLEPNLLVNWAPSHLQPMSCSGPDPRNSPCFSNIPVSNSGVPSSRGSPDGSPFSCSANPEPWGSSLQNLCPTQPSMTPAPRTRVAPPLPAPPCHSHASPHMVQMAGAHLLSSMDHEHFKGRTLSSCPHASFKDVVSSGH